MLELKKATEVKESFFNFAQNLIKTYEGFEDNYYTLDYILKNREKGIENNYLVVMKNNKIIDFIYYGKFLGIEEVSLMCFYFKYDKKEFFEVLKNFFKDTPFLINSKSINYYCIWNKNEELSIEDLGFVECNTKFSLNETFRLSMRNEHFYTLKENVNMLRDAFERKYLPSNIDNLKFEMVNESELIKILYDKDYDFIPSYITEGNQRVVIGFHYLSFQFESPNANYLICRNGENQIVGVIKWALYREGFKDVHYGLNYIDVISTFRGKGIASKLINEFTKYVDNNYPLVLSYESKMGEICKIHDHFKKASFKTKVYTDKEWENYWYNL